MNREYIAQNLCENKEREEELVKTQKVNDFASHCAGSCQLKKRLAEADKDAQESSPVSPKYALDVLFLEHEKSFSFDNQLFDSEINILNGFYKDFDSTSTLHSIFRPPVCT